MKYHKVSSSNTSRLEAHAGFFRLLKVGSLAKIGHFITHVFSQKFIVAIATFGNGNFLPKMRKKVANFQKFIWAKIGQNRIFGGWGIKKTQKT